jgi:hypothetical protein
LGDNLSGAGRQFVARNLCSRASTDKVPKPNPVLAGVVDDNVLAANEISGGDQHAASRFRQFNGADAKCRLRGDFHIARPDRLNLAPDL